MEKITIKQIGRFTENKQTGKKYDGVQVMITDEKDRKMSYFDKYGKAKDWKEGMELEGTIEEVAVGDKLYLNFRPKTNAQYYTEQMKKFDMRLTKMELAIKRIEAEKGLTKDTTPLEDINF